MSRVLIVTIPGDVHAHAARWALEELGHTCARWLPQDLERAVAALQLSNDERKVVLSASDGMIDASELDTVWLRRVRMPEAPDTLPLGDKLVAERESEAFLRGLVFALEPRLWANAPAAQRAAALKTPQLVAARKVGLAIPPTLMTNDMETLRTFFRSSSGRVIYKGFHPAIWRAGTSDQFVLQTVVLDEDDLEDPESLRLSPGIFQTFVPKQYELRVTIFGRTCIAAQITEQDEIDWRPTYKMKLSPYQLPAAVEAKLLALMDELGLSMGAVDLIVTPEGQYVFLEVNEQGQFLWVEEMCPEVALLEPFAHFLASGRREFRWDGHSSGTLTFGAYCQSSAGAQFLAEERPNAKPSKVTVPEPAELTPAA